MQSLDEQRNGSDEIMVTEWRHEQLCSAGFPLPLATALARDLRHDLHALIDLAARGCPPELAARILAPLDPELPAA
ncbi:MAG: hypothetical protein ACXVY8_07905 [Gaiellaceae bacterium]